MRASKLFRKLMKLAPERKDDGDNKNRSQVAETVSHTTPDNTTATTHHLQEQKQKRVPDSYQAATPGEDSDSIEVKSPSRFLSLPGEVRNLIYSYVVFPSLERLSVCHRADLFLSPSIFRVSHQIREEAISYLCVEKVVDIYNIQAANAFFGVIGKKGIHSLRHVTLRCSESWRWTAAVMVERKETLLAHMAYTSALQRFELIVGRRPMSLEDLRHLESDDMPGAKFIIAMRSVINGVGMDINEAPAEMHGRYRKDVNEAGAVEVLMVEQDLHRDVFRLCKITEVTRQMVDLKVNF